MQAAKITQFADRQPQSALMPPLQRAVARTASSAGGPECHVETSKMWNNRETTRHRLVWQ